MNIKILFTISYAIILALSLLIGNYYFALMSVSLMAFVIFFNINAKFIILSIIALFPFSIGNLAGKELLTVEIIAPLAFIYMFYLTRIFAFILSPSSLS